jgi:hypothetical protein
MKRIVSTTLLILLSIGMLALAFNLQPIRVHAQQHTSDMELISLIIAAFMSYPEHPLWNPSADLNQDGFVDMMDLAIAMTTF